MMTEPKPNPLIRYLIEQFKRAAIVVDFGYIDEDHAMQRAGIRSARQAIMVLDTCGPDARQALVPLLEDPNPAIRVYAAGFLLKVMPERALPVLKEIDEHCMERTTMTAFRILRRYERGDLDW
jgi:hypothetical protein